jgi:hypothetical protein
MHTCTRSHVRTSPFKHIILPSCQQRLLKLSGIIRNCTAQDTYWSMVKVLEDEVATLLSALKVTLTVVTDDEKGFAMFDAVAKSQSASGDQEMVQHTTMEGLAAAVYSSATAKLVKNPAAASAYVARMDPGGHAANAALWYGAPVLACVDTSPINASPVVLNKNLKVIAVLGVFLSASTLSNEDQQAVALLGQLAGDMLSRAKMLNHANGLYKSSLAAQKQSNSLLDVALALSSDLNMQNVISVISSMVPELMQADR